MVKIFSTATAHPRERLSYWLEVATETYIPHDFSSKSGQAFRGNLRVGAIGNLCVTSFDVDACEVRRCDHHIRRSNEAKIFLHLQVSGQAHIAQDGCDAIVNGGDLAIVDTRRAFDLNLSDRSCAIVITVPPRDLEARVGNIAAFTGHVIEGDDPVGGLAISFLSMLPERVDMLDDATALKVSDTALDLTALALSSSACSQRSLAVSSAKTAALSRLKATIESRLSDPQLKPQSAAAYTGISVRYANALLATENTSLERYILDRRLERCRRALEDPGQMHRTTCEIAFSWGFADISHFGRRFKERFGAPPTEYRRRHPE